jgi:hypothetical protein
MKTPINLPQMKFLALLSLLWISIGTSATAFAAAPQAKKPSNNGIVTTPPGAIALRDQLRAVMNMTSYTGSFMQSGSHVVLNKVGTVYTVRRSNVLVTTYFTTDKYAGVRVLNQAADDKHYYATTRYCHNDSVVTLPEVTLAPVPDNCRRALAMGKVGLVEAGKKMLVTDIEVVPEQDMVSMVLLEHHLNQGQEDSRYGVGLRVQFPHGFLATADAGKIAEMLKTLLAPADDAALAQSFMPDAPLPVYSVEDKLNAMFKPLQFHFSDGTYTPDVVLKVKADRFLRGASMYAAILGCLPTFEDGKPQPASFICRSLNHGEPDGKTSVYLKPDDDLEVASIKVELKKDKDIVRLVVNDWSQHDDQDPPKLSDVMDIEVNGEQVDSTSNFDHTGYHSALQLQYPKGTLERSGIDPVVNDIRAIFNVTKVPAASGSGVNTMTASTSAPPPPPPPPFAGTPGPPQSLEEQLKTVYKLTQVSADSTVLSAGTVFKVVPDKVLLGTPVAKPAMCASSVVEGKPKPPAAACVTPLKPSILKRESTYFAAGQKVDMVALSVNIAKETVSVTLVDDASGAKPHLHTQVNFVFPQGYLETSDAGQVGDLMNTVLPLADANDAPPPPAASVPSGAARAPVAPPAQPAGGVPTVRKGMSKADVLTILGKPKNIVDVPPKSIFTYDGMRVIFLNGKVSDVQ